MWRWFSNVPDATLGTFNVRMCLRRRGSARNRLPRGPPEKGEHAALFVGVGGRSRFRTEKLGSAYDHRHQRYLVERIGRYGFSATASAVRWRWSAMMRRA